MPVCLYTHITLNVYVFVYMRPWVQLLLHHSLMIWVFRCVNVNINIGVFLECFCICTWLRHACLFVYTTTLNACVGCFICLFHIHDVKCNSWLLACIRELFLFCQKNEIMENRVLMLLGSWRRYLLICSAVEAFA